MSSPFYHSNEEIEQLMERFLSGTLPKEKWTHAAHLTGAIWFLKKFEPDDAICRIRSGIISYNLSVGGENTGTGGYHESITLFWMDVLHIFVRAHAELSLADTCNKFLASPLADKNLPFIFYNKEYLLSPLARARAVLPDIKQVSADTVLPIERVNEN